MRSKDKETPRIIMSWSHGISSCISSVVLVLEEKWSHFTCFCKLLKKVKCIRFLRERERERLCNYYCSQSKKPKRRCSPQKLVRRESLMFSIAHYNFVISSHYFQFHTKRQESSSWWSKERLLKKNERFEGKTKKKCKTRNCFERKLWFRDQIFSWREFLSVHACLFLIQNHHSKLYPYDREADLLQEKHRERERHEYLCWELH